MIDLFEQEGINPFDDQDLFKKNKGNSPVDLFEQNNINYNKEATGFPGIWGDIKNSASEAKENIPGIIGNLPESFWSMIKSGATMPYEGTKAFIGGGLQGAKNQNKIISDTLREYLNKRFDLNVPSKEELIQNARPEYKNFLEKTQNIHVPWEPKGEQSWGEFLNPDRHEDPGLQGIEKLGEYTAPLRLASSLKLGGKIAKTGAQTVAAGEQALANKENPFEAGSFPALGRVAEATLKVTPHAWNAGVGGIKAAGSGIKAGANAVKEIPKAVKTILKKDSEMDNIFEQDIQTSKGGLVSKIQKANEIENAKVGSRYSEWEKEAGKNEITKILSEKDLGISAADLGENGAKLLSEFTKKIYKWDDNKKEFSKIPEPKNVQQALKLYRQARDEKVNAKNDADRADNSELANKYHEKAKRLEQAKNKFENIIKENTTPEQYSQWKGINKQFVENVLPFRETPLLKQTAKKHGNKIPEKNTLKILQGQNIPAFMKNIKENHPELAKAFIEHDFRELNFNDIKAMENAVKADTMGYIPESTRKLMNERIQELKYEEKVKKIKKSITNAVVTGLAGKGIGSMF